MKTTTRKIGNSVGVIIPSEIKVQTNKSYEIYKVGEAIVMVPNKEDLFKIPEDWKDFRQSITQEDDEWDQMED